MYDNIHQHHWSEVKLEKDYCVRREESICRYFYNIIKLWYFKQLLKLTLDIIECFINRT